MSLFCYQPSFAVWFAPLTGIIATATGEEIYQQASEEARIVECAFRRARRWIRTVSRLEAARLNPIEALPFE